MANDAGRTVRVSSRITGVGRSVPERVVPNDYFASYLNTSDQWIRERTGIRERRWADPKTVLSELAEPAARAAIKNAGLRPEDIDGIVFGTVTPDFLFPGAACCLQKRLGVAGSFAFDVNAVCSGFVYALVCGDSLIANGLGRHVLVVGGDLFSNVIDPNERATCVLFGDAAGAAVLSRVVDDEDAKRGILQKTGDPRTLRGIYGSELHADGSGGHLLTVGSVAAQLPQGREKPGTGTPYLHMAGKEVFRFAVRSFVEMCKKLPEKYGFSISDLSCVISHQANMRILAAAVEQLGVDTEVFPMNVEQYGNTSAASVPLLLAETVEKGRIKEGDLVLIVAFGAGLTWGGTLLRW